MERYKKNEIRRHQFIQVPKELFNNSRYSNLSCEAKILYGLLLDRLELSRENGWINKNGEIYLIYTREKIEDILKISHPTCCNAFKHLKNAELIQEERQGLGKPNLIYIGHIIYDCYQVVENTKKLKKLTSGSKKNELVEVKKFNANNTYYNNTNIINEEEETFNEICNKFKKYIKSDVTEYEINSLQKLKDRTDGEILVKAIRTSGEKGGRSIGYVIATIEDWGEKGLNTIGKIEKYLTDRKRNQKKDKNNKNNKINKSANYIGFNNFEPRKHSDRYEYLKEQCLLGQATEEERKEFDEMRGEE